LEDTNRGVVALYAELDEQAGHLRRADEMKSRFLSNMSHEFRTPLNAILALSQLLLDRTDGALTGEQEKQVGYIRRSGEDLLELVNDLLDLAKIEAGKIDVKPAACDVATLFSALRGMLRPLLASGAVTLVFDEPQGVPTLLTDEGKVSQILRNFISNAIKFTERGEVRVAAGLSEDGDRVVFSVADTGIGIAEEDQARIFEEFSQIDHPIQRRVKGTGLGLPLCRKLAGLLGGSVEVVSRLGEGSTFMATIPVAFPTGEPDTTPAGGETWEPDERRAPVVLIIDDQETDRYILRRHLEEAGCAVVEAEGGKAGLEAARARKPTVIFLDLNMPQMDGYDVLAQLRDDETTAAIPVAVVTSLRPNPEGDARLAHARAVLNKQDVSTAALRQVLDAARSRSSVAGR